MIISVSHLSKYYQVHKKEPGLVGSLKSFVARKYETVKAVEDISFQIHEAELIGFIGPNGAGKTTTLKCLSGLLYPTSGKISVLGFTPYKRGNQFLKQISLVMGQKNQLWWDLTAMDTLLLNKDIYDVPKQKFLSLIDELSHLLQVDELLKVPVKKLSLGERMKCELIAALIHSPKVLFLDEPTIGLDVVMQKNLRDFIRQYNKLYKATVILTSHYMRDVQALCKRVIIINHGKILYDGLLQDLVKQYSSFKIINVVLSNQVDLKDLTGLGEIKKNEFPELRLRIKSNDASRVTSRILKDFRLVDLTIEDEDIEDIIREVFLGAKKLE